MDELDEKILLLLKEDARKPFVELAKELNVSEGAVRKRVKTLWSKGVIRKFTIEMNYQRKVRAFVLITTDTQSSLPEISSKLREVADVREVHEVAGEYDVICMVDGDSLAVINSAVDKMRAIKGVVRTVTSFLLA